MKLESEKRHYDKDVSYWRNRYEKQSRLVDAINALLSRYGKSLDLPDLYREFLLTLMGQFSVSDGCLYAVEIGSEDVHPALCYGELRFEDLKSINIQSRIPAYLRENRSPCRMSEMPEFILEDEPFNTLKDVADVCGPVCLKDRMLGIVFLGRKVTGDRFHEFDLRLLSTLCGISAVTFNNALLHESAKISMNEVKRLFDLRTEMINRISHEFRTPLTVAKAGLEMAKEMDDPASVLDTISDAIDGLDNLISSLLQLNRQHQTGSIDEKRSFNLWSEIYEVVAKYKEQLQAKSLTLDLRSFLLEEAPELKISAGDFKAVVSALLENAVRFSNESSNIEISVELVTRAPDETIDGHLIENWETHTRKVLREYGQTSNGRHVGPVQPGERDPDREDVQENASDIEHCVVLRITDSGIGIPDGEIGFLIEPFRQASNSPDRGVKGRGLGLSVVQKILERCQGRICCRSREGIGTTFSIFLPLA
ncbi:MAG: HAMP domain-containing histidine kinase [Candidatus Latescibacterota bacterium]|nr:MAG: HAMP domain-containing histidine kinase [Candidatus Latescibacterota bacterium]